MPDPWTVDKLSHVLDRVRLDGDQRAGLASALDAMVGQHNADMAALWDDLQRTTTERDEARQQLVGATKIHDTHLKEAAERVRAAESRPHPDDVRELQERIEALEHANAELRDQIAQTRAPAKGQAPVKHLPAKKKAVR